MKITTLTYVSRGDVQPFLPLSLRLLPRCKMIIHHGGTGTTSADAYQILLCHSRRINPFREIGPIRSARVLGIFRWGSFQ